MKKAVEAVSEGLLLSSDESFFRQATCGMMCPADEASLTQRLRRNTKTDADDSGSYGQYSYNRYSLDNICNQMATKQSNSRTTTGA
ncbi:MAG: hypothetical protein ACLRI8_05045 [Agathobacter rectalis]